MKRCAKAAACASAILYGTDALRGKPQQGAAMSLSARRVHVKAAQTAQSEFALDHTYEADMMTQMTVANAMDIIGSMNGSKPQLVSALQDQLRAVKSGKHLRQKQPDGGVAAAQAAGSYGSGAQKALDMLNEMLLEAIEKMDFEVVRCDSEERVNLAALAEIRQDVIMFNGMAAGAATTMNKAKGDSTRFTGLLESTKAEFQKNQAICYVERTDLEGKIKIVGSDLDVMKVVVGMTDCGDSASASFYQCVDTKTNSTWTELRPSDKLQEEIKKIKNPKVREILENRAIFLEGGSQPSSGLTEPAAGATTGAAASTSKCSLASSPMCPRIREKFTDLAGEVLDSLNELKLMLKNLNLHCSETGASISSQIVNYGNVISETNEKLSGATKDWGTYSGQKGQKSAEERDVHKEHMDTMTACRINIENLASEKCALKKIRGELLKMDSLPSTVTDCDVGEWQADPCSVDCGGGKQNLTRSMTPGVMGAACPAGKAMQTCNEGRCPVDCVMEEWSEWGSCTALCDGGIKERARGIKVPALTKEAVQCEETAETVPCNVQACAGDCQLSDWTQWATECTKPCGGGEVTRVKQLVKPAFGTGSCPAFYDEARYQIKACNTQACPPMEKPFTCSAKLDVIILFDGSASIEQEGWEQVVKGVQELAKAFDGPNVKLASMLFSGPTNFDNVGPCIGQLAPGQNATALDPIKDCGIEWLVRFDANATGEAVAEAVGKAKFPQGTTLTSLAMAEAGAELSQGRQDANSIVIVFTDGSPLSVLEASKQSEKLKKKARLMFVPVGTKFQDVEAFQAWASSPWKDNIVRVEDLKMVPTAITVNQILTNFCPNLMYGNETINQIIVKESPQEPLR